VVRWIDGKAFPGFVERVLAAVTDWGPPSAGPRAGDLYVGSRAGAQTDL